MIKENKVQFFWKDSLLVKALLKGQIVIIKNCQDVNPALLEKLNTLLEEQFLVINESFDENGNVRIVNQHRDFRIILQFDQTKK